MSPSPSWFDKERFAKLVHKVGRIPAESPPPSSVTSPSAISMAPPAKSQPPISVAPPMPKPAKSPQPNPLATLPVALPSPSMTPALPVVESPAVLVGRPQNSSASIAPDYSAQLRRELESNARKLIELEKEKDNLQQNLADSIQELERRRAEDATNKEAWERLQLDLEDRQLQLDQAQEKATRLQQQLDAKIEEAFLQSRLTSGQNEELNQIKRLQQIDHETLAQEKLRLVQIEQRDLQLEQRNRELEQELQTLLTEQQDERRHHHELNGEVTLLRGQAQENQAMIAHLQEVLQTARQEVLDSTNAREELQQVQRRYDSYRAETEQTQAILAQTQKNLENTRAALKQATEDSAPKALLDNMRSEYNNILQQNMLLQAQFDQQSRELSATRAKLNARA